MSRLHKIANYGLIILAIVSTNGIICDRSEAAPQTETESKANPAKTNKNTVYTPIPLPPTGEVKDVLSDKDIPTGEGGFAKDYAIKLTSGDQIAIDLNSEVFDTVIILINAEGKTVSKNDDGPDGTSNSLLFTRIKNSGNYVIRVQGFGETSSGEFKLKVSKLKSQ
jgi:Bacterial pre-peptidase C-terminal domain